MLVGREPECARLDHALTEAKTGRSAAFVVTGEPGIGKSALLSYARERADAMAVLSTTGVESESKLPFSGLADLCNPVISHIQRLPAPQAAALRAALALGPPAGDRFAAYAGALALLASVAEKGSLLVVVDDAHWLDPRSAEALLFVARRLEAEGIVLLFAVRSGEDSLVANAGLSEINVSGLDERAAAELLAERAPGTPEHVSAAIFAAARGNPLALLELPTVLSADQLAGTEPVPDPLPTGRAIERAFSRRISKLPEDSQEALVVAAASASGDMSAIRRALQSLGLGPDALEAAEEAGLVRFDGDRLAFSHPLVRSTVYHGATPPSRRAAHGALAAAVGDRASLERAWHLAAAAVAPDGQVAAALERAGDDARQRNAIATAATAFEGAARFSAQADERLRRLLVAGEAMTASGRFERGLDLLDEALTYAEDPLLRADVQYLRGTIEMMRSGPRGARDLLLREAAAVERRHPARASQMVSAAAFTCLMAGQVDAALETAARAAVLAEQSGPPAQVMASAVLAPALILVGRGDEAKVHLDHVRGFFERADGLAPEPVMHALLHGPIYLEAYEDARATLEPLVARARAAGAVGLLIYPLAVSADLAFRTGQFRRSYAYAAEALSLSEATGQASERAVCLFGLAQVEAVEGRETACRSHAGEALALSESLGVGFMPAFSGFALGLLEVGLARYDEAVQEFEQVAKWMREMGVGEPNVLQWAANLIEAYVYTGRHADAAQALAELEQQATRTGRISAHAAVARARGLLADDEDESEAAFEDALRWHDRTPTPFERARTELCLGVRRRRAGRRVLARRPLRSALATFDRVGASPWSERARRELAATGETARRRDPEASQRLTASELRVALIVGRGATTREAAATLFLSPKTIEFHLGHVYSKLNIRSRAELARLVARDEGLAAASDVAS